MPFMTLRRTLSAATWIYSIFPLISIAATLPQNPIRQETDPRPNIIFIMADDIGIGDLGFYQKQFNKGKTYVETPTLDRLIENGMRFERAHSSTALCSPTRYCVLSGN